MMTDPIADMLTRIRNAHLALHKEVSVPSSKMKEAIAAILKQEGYVDDVTVEDRNINIQPGRRVYVGAHEIPRVQNGLGICILSTSHGVLAGDKAHQMKVGGELLCEIW